MGLAAFFGYLFLAGGPLAVVFLFCIATKSFLVLLSLASAFYWLVTLFLISAIFRGFAPLDPSIGPYVGLVLVAVLIQEAARMLLWRFHRLSLRALEYVATLQEHRGASLTTADHFSLTLSHGLSHASVHSIFFCISFLPLCLGDGTVYTNTCPKMSYFLVSSLTTLAFAGILTSAMILSFEGLESKNLKQGLAPSLVHVAAALITLINFEENGCLISIPILFGGAAAMVAWAGTVWWKRTAQVLRRRASEPSRSPRRNVE